MPTIVTRDGTEIYYKDWGSGPPVVFSHGWPLTADSWEAQMLFLAARGYPDAKAVHSAEESLIFSLPKELRRDIKAAQQARA